MKEEKILYWAKSLEHKSLSVHELVENAKWLLSNQEKPADKIIQIQYGDAMDMLNAIEAIAASILEFGVEIEILEGGDGYEEIKISKVEEQYREVTIEGIKAKLTQEELELFLRWAQS